MPQKQYVKVARDIFKQSWMRNGSADSKLIYLYYIAHPLSSLIGLVPLDFDQIEFDLQIPHDRAKVAIDYLKGLGKLDYDENYLLTIGYVEFQGLGGKALIGADLEVQSMEDKTSLLSKIPIASPLDTPSIPHTSGMNPSSTHNIKLHNIKLHNKNITTLPKPAVSAVRSESEKYLEMADQAKAFILTQAADRNLNIKSVKFDSMKDARQIRLLCETDGVKLDSILPGLEYAWNGCQFDWGRQLISISHWRTKTKGSPEGKFVNMLNQQSDPGNPQPRGGSTPPSKIEKDGYV